MKGSSPVDGLTIWVHMDCMCRKDHSPHGRAHHSGTRELRLWFRSRLQRERKPVVISSEGIVFGRPGIYKLAPSLSYSTEPWLLVVWVLCLCRGSLPMNTDPPKKRRLPENRIPLAVGLFAERRVRGAQELKVTRWIAALVWLAVAPAVAGAMSFQAVVDCGSWAA